MLTWTNQPGSGHFAVEWSSALTGSWSSSWTDLAYISATSSTSHVQVPMFYRLRWYDSPSLEEKAEIFGTGTGARFSYSTTLGKLPYRNGTIVVTDGTSLVTDADGDGQLEGKGIGSIDYETGDLDVTFTLAPVNGATITVSYKHLIHPFEGPFVSSAESLGTGNGAIAFYAGTLVHAPVNFVSLRITDSIETFVDFKATPRDGLGNMGEVRIWGDQGGIGYFNYFTGEIEVTFFTAPPLGQSVMVYYDYVLQ